MTPIDVLEKFSFKTHSKFELRKPLTVEEKGRELRHFTGVTFSGKLFCAGRPICTVRKDFLDVKKAFSALEDDIATFSKNNLVYNCSIICHVWERGRSTDQVLFKSARSDQQNVWKNIYDKIRIWYETDAYRRLTNF